MVVETKLPAMGSLRVNYNGNLQLTFADLSDYNLMNSYEKLTFERLAGCYRLIDDEGNILDEEQDQIYNDLMKEVDVYDLSGRMVRRQVRKSEALRGLHKGIYIMDGKKYVVK